MEARPDALEDGAALVRQQVHLVDDEQPARRSKGSVLLRKRHDVLLLLGGDQAVNCIGLRAAELDVPVSSFILIPRDLNLAEKFSTTFWASVFIVVMYTIFFLLISPPSLW